jgi:hypothetical protein
MELCRPLYALGLFHLLGNRSHLGQAPQEQAVEITKHMSTEWRGLGEKAAH